MAETKRGSAEDLARDSAGNSAVARLEAALARIADPAGEGARTCLTVYAEEARATAAAADIRRKAGRRLGPLDGALVTIKDLFDVAGEVTRAGSREVALHGKPAERDAPVVARLRAAGTVIVAKTNMTEFAFSGIGANPHFGTPGNPFDRARAPGGSTSGGAVAVADHFCDIAIGTDTGGSTRTPAALCGIVGFKPTAARIPREGAFPLSFTLDSVGPLARSVQDCADADAVLAGLAPAPLEAAPLAGLRIGIAQGFPLDGMEPTVAARFADALERLRQAGASLREAPLPLLSDMQRINASGGITAAESWAIHRARIAAHGDMIDAFVRGRIEKGAAHSAADYLDMQRERAALAAAMDRQLAAYDALVLPTTPVLSPLLSEVTTPEGFTAKNTLLLRNTAIANFFDLCAISLPLPEKRPLPSGLMLFGRHGADRQLLAIAQAVEALLGAA